MAIAYPSRMDDRLILVGWMGKFWQGRTDSNCGPTVLETVALPTELRPYTTIQLRWARHYCKPESAEIYSVRLLLRWQISKLGNWAQC